MASLQEELRDRDPIKEGSRARAQRNAPGAKEAARAFADMWAGALRGGVKATLGIPGDVESLVRMATGGEQRLPTTEDWDKRLPPVREGQAASPFEKLGEFTSPESAAPKFAKGAVQLGRQVARNIEKGLPPAPVPGGLRAQGGHIGEPPSRTPGDADAPKPQDVLRQREVEAPPETSKPKRIQSGERKGYIRGTEGFGGITPQKARAMRDAYLKRMAEGVEGRHWYDESSALIHQLVGGDPVKADQLASTLAVTSAGDRVQSNLGHALRAWNQAAIGEPIQTGKYPTAMSANVQSIMDDPTGAAAASGLKRNPFSAGLSVHWRGPDVQRATHDIHDVRAWGIKDPKTGEEWKKGLSPAQHRFLDEQMDKVVAEANRRGIGGVTDWKNFRGQAAAWIAQKARTDNIPIEEAAKDYSAIFDDYVGQISREHIPAGIPGRGGREAHFPEAASASPERQQMYHDEMERIVSGDEPGRDRLSQQMGLLVRDTRENPGWYEGVSAPGTVTEFGAGRAASGVDPATAQAARSTAAGHSILSTQNQGAWNASTAKNAPIRSGGAYHVDMGRPMTPGESARLSDVVGAQGRKGPDWLVPQVDVRGGRVLELAPPDDPGRPTMMAALRGEFPDAQIGLRRNESGLVPPQRQEEFSYRPHIDEVLRGGERMVAGFDRAMKTMAPQALEVAGRWATQEGWSQAPWFPTAMKALAEGGLRELDRLQKAGVVPVAFVTGTAAALIGASGGDELPGGV